MKLKMTSLYACKTYRWVLWDRIISTLSPEVAIRISCSTLINETVPSRHQFFWVSHIYEVRTIPHETAMADPDILKGVFQLVLKKGVPTSVTHPRSATETGIIKHNSKPEISDKEEYIWEIQKPTLFKGYKDI